MELLETAACTEPTWPPPHEPIADAAAPDAPTDEEDAPLDPPAWWAALETMAITALLPALGWQLHRADPLFTTAPFAWPLLAPLLAGLRHGFAAGCSSALLLSLALLSAPRLGVAAPASPIQLIVGLLFVGMAAGEFAHRNRRALASARTRADERGLRLDELGRALALLRASHDRLEQQVAGGTHSLRAALTDIRARLARGFDGPPPFFGQQREILRLLGRFASVQVASLHPVLEGRVLAAVERLGEMLPGAEADLLCREAVRVRAVVSVRDFASRGEGATELLAALPLIDVRGQLRGLVAVRELPFHAFTDDNLKLLGILAAHLADALAEVAQAMDESVDPAREFEDGLRRCLDDRRRQGLPAAICAVAVDDAAAVAPVLTALRSLHRGPDRVWVRDAGRRGAAAWMLLPLTDEPGLAGFMARLRAECAAPEGDGAFRTHARLLDPQDEAAAVLDEMRTWSGDDEARMVRLARA